MIGSLPIPVPSRFRTAQRAALVAGPSTEFEVLVLERFRSRLLGLMALDEDEARPVLLPRCAAVHSFWMRFEIDVCFLALPRRVTRAPRRTREARVLEVAAGLPPRSRCALSPAQRADLRSVEVAVLELPGGRADALGITPGRDLKLLAAAG